MTPIRLFHRALGGYQQNSLTTIDLFSSSTRVNVEIRKAPAAVVGSPARFRAVLNSCQKRLVRYAGSVAPCNTQRQSWYVVPVYQK